MREAVGIWDESPLQKWLFRGPDALQAADYCFTNDMASLEVGQARYGAFCDEHGQDARRRRRVPRRERRRACWSSRRCRPTPTTSARILAGPRRRRSRTAPSACRTCRCRARARASCSPRSPTRTCAGLRYFRFIPRPVTHRRRRRLPGSRARATRARSATRSTARPRAPSSSGSRCSTRAPASASGPTASRRWSRCASRAGLIFIGFDYFQGLTSPYHVNLDKVIRLDHELPRARRARGRATRPASRTAS